jgi:hypothetical protein
VRAWVQTSVLSKNKKKFKNLKKTDRTIETKIYYAIL